MAGRHLEAGAAVHDLSPGREEGTARPGVVKIVLDKRSPHIGSLRRTLSGRETEKQRDGAGWGWGTARGGDGGQGGRRGLGDTAVHGDGRNGPAAGRFQRWRWPEDSLGGRCPAEAF